MATRARDSSKVKLLFEIELDYGEEEDLIVDRKFLNEKLLRKKVLQIVKEAVKNKDSASSLEYALTGLLFPLSRFLSSQEEDEFIAPVIQTDGGRKISPPYGTKVDP